MTTRETSVRAYMELGKFLNDSYNMIMDAILSRPDRENWTAREVRQVIIDDEVMEKDKCLSSSIHARMNEMRKKDMVFEVGKRRCSVSGRMAIVVTPSFMDYREWRRGRMEVA